MGSSRHCAKHRKDRKIRFPERGSGQNPGLCWQFLATTRCYHYHTISCDCLRLPRNLPTKEASSYFMKLICLSRAGICAANWFDIRATFEFIFVHIIIVSTSAWLAATTYFTLQRCLLLKKMILTSITRQLSLVLKMCLNQLSRPKSWAPLSKKPWPPCLCFLLRICAASRWNVLRCVCIFVKPRTCFV